MKKLLIVVILVMGYGMVYGADEWWKPYSPPCTERENVFEFTEKPKVRKVAEDRYEITFAVKGYCDVTVAIIDPDPKKELVPGRGIVVRHLGAGVLGPNAPSPFQKNSLKQTLYWDGKDDLGFYHKDPQNLKVRVSLGLKPEFDKLLGPTTPKALPGHIWGIGADADGVYVFIASGGFTHISLRKFDHDANYVAELYPPSADLPREKLGGMGFVEYEPGKYALHAPVLSGSMWRDGKWMPKWIDGGEVIRCRPAVTGGRIYFLNSGRVQGQPRAVENRLHYLLTNGTTEYIGLAGRVWWTSAGRPGQSGLTHYPSFAASPDGKILYMVGLHREQAGSYGQSICNVLLCGPVDGSKHASVLVGNTEGPGADVDRFNFPTDVATDQSGRVYVTDRLNNRVQIFSSEGKFLKSVEIERPHLIQVHQKTGEIYVAHQGRREGKSISRLTRLTPFPELSVNGQWDDIPLEVMTLDSWAPKPRLWVSGQSARMVEGGVAFGPGVLLRVYEIDGTQVRIVSDFEEEARAAAGANYIEWPGSIGYPVNCDPVRERAYYCHQWVFDLVSGKLIGPSNIAAHSPAEIGFDKRGFMHIRHGGHDAPKNVIRVDPDRVVNGRCVEVPYDYGEQWSGYAGALRMPATDTQFYSWGLGVNMQGDVAALHWIGYSPRFQDEVDADLGEFFRSGRGLGKWTIDVYGNFLKRLKELDRLGEDLFYIRPQPGIDLVGGVISVFNRNGELLNMASVIIGQYRSNGAQIDEDGCLYFVNGRQRLFGNRLFLQDKAGNFGGEPIDDRNRTPFTGTYIKVRQDHGMFLRTKPRIARDAVPERPPDLATPGFGGGHVKIGAGGDTWAEGVEWMFAGASPIVADHCSCPHMRASLDWYKRSFVPENYRHSIGVIDTNGNLICHVGRYGNFDNGGGPGRRIPPGSDGIAMTRGAFVSTTDNYLVISDWGHRLIVARLNYNIEETAEISKD